MTLTIANREVPADDSLPVAALAAQLRLPDGWETVPGQFSRLAGRLRAAVDAIEARTGRVLLQRHFVLEGRTAGGRLLTLPVAPVRSLINILVDEAPMDLTGAVIDADGPKTIVVLAQSLTAGSDVQVTVDAGLGDWPALPEGLAEAVLLQAETYDGGGSPETETLAARLIAPYRHLRLGRG